MKGPAATLVPEASVAFQLVRVLNRTREASVPGPAAVFHVTARIFSGDVRQHHGARLRQARQTGTGSFAASRLRAGLCV